LLELLVARYYAQVDAFGRGAIAHFSQLNIEGGAAAVTLLARDDDTLA